MTVPAAVGVGRAILTGVCFYAVVSDGSAMIIFGLRNGFYLPLTNPGIATSPNRACRQRNETSDEQEQNAEVEFHDSRAKVVEAE